MLYLDSSVELDLTGLDVPVHTPYHMGWSSRTERGCGSLETQNGSWAPWQMLATGVSDSDVAVVIAGAWYRTHTNPSDRVQYVDADGSIHPIPRDPN
ncbi:hypothetical protein KC930_03945 [Candidatus Saccharibacteria bacterium]|nr:hypothetical protein [Candidatus Saccharibacteria bacterium]